MSATNNNIKIVSRAPGRTCLFGDHQDYLGLPVIACAFNRYITLTATKNDSRFLHIDMPDVHEKRSIAIDEPIEILEKGDHLLAAIRVLKRYGCVPDSGFNVSIAGNLPINAGASSSTALVMAWISFLLEAFDDQNLANPAFIAEIAYKAEVLEQAAPGGRMDHYSIGLGNIIFLETGDRPSYEILGNGLNGLIVGESGIPKETIGLLSNIKQSTLAAIDSITTEIPDFNIKQATLFELPNYLKSVPLHQHQFIKAAISNHDITKKAYREFKAADIDLKRIGTLMNEHHDILKNLLGITVPRIDAMIEAALAAGAFGAKIVGSGGGGSIIAIAPEGLETAIIDAIKNAGAKDAYSVEVDQGAQIVKSSNFTKNKK